MAEPPAVDPLVADLGHALGALGDDHKLHDGDHREHHDAHHQVALHHELTALCAALASSGLPLHLETSGVDPLSGRFDWITLSPKSHRPPTTELLASCHELKVVVHGAGDLTFAEAMAAAAKGLRAAGNQPALLLQPGWDSQSGQALATAHVLRHPQWRLSLQSHKWLGLR